MFIFFVFDTWLHSLHDRYFTGHTRFVNFMLNLSYFAHVFLDCGRKAVHADTGRTYILHTDRAQIALCTGGLEFTCGSPETACLGVWM